MSDKKIDQKFDGKLLGVRNNKLKPNYYVHDFLNHATLVDFIVSTYDHESTFTKDGFNFIEQYYGLENVIDIVLEKYPDYPFDEGVTPEEALLIKKQYAIDE